MHIIEIIFNSFEKNNIRYCHFKSNQHLKESFDGISDFDILVDYKQSKECKKILLDNNCKQFEPLYIGDYPSVENWIAFDKNSGKIFHIHLHFHLASGKSLVKEYFLPWSELILDTSTKSDEYNILISNPHVELLLLVSRIVIKSKISSSLKAIFGKYHLPDDMDKEYKYLKNRINKKEIEIFALQMFEKNAAQQLIGIIQNHDTISSKEFKIVRRIVKSQLKNSKRINNIRASIGSRFFRLIDLKNKFMSRKLGIYKITKKVNSAGGKIIAFIGVDGCGKSTLSEEVRSWLDYKIEVKRFYMGEGDGKVNLFATLVKKVYSLLYAKKQRNRISVKTNSGNNNKKVKFLEQPIEYLKKYIHALMIYSVVKSNYRKIRKMNQYRMNGGFSILDRYPQLQHEGMNDGLKLNRYATVLDSKFIQKLAYKERKFMEITNDIQPDIVFRLNIRPEISMKRKPEEQTDYHAIKEKADACSTIYYKKSKMIEIDAEQDLNKVILLVKNLIWSQI